MSLILGRDPIATTDRSPAFTGAPATGLRLRRALLVAALVAGAGWAVAATGSREGAEAVARAGAELTALLRFMAAVKASMALGALAALWWRFALAAASLRVVAYLAGAGAMAAGPVLIWGMAHVGLGALLLHGGLFATLVMLWRDPAVAAELTARVAARRRALASQPPPHAAASPSPTNPPLCRCHRSA